MNINHVIAQELNIRPAQADAAIRLIDEGCTIPFIARYRKEATDSLNDEQLRNLFERLTYLRGLEERKASVLASIEEQGKLTQELRAQIEAAMTQVALEDLYRPYKQKRRTRAGIAKEAGLAPLAEQIFRQEMAEDPLKEAEKYIDPEKKISSAKEALAGALDIIAEQISDDPEVRMWVREITKRRGTLTSTAKDPEAKSVYEQYYAFESPVGQMAGHRTLAVNRGEKEKFLTVKIEAPEEEILQRLGRKLIRKELLRGKSEAAPHAAADRGRDGAGLGSRLPHGLQAGSGGSDGQGAGHGGHLSDSSHQRAEKGSRPRRAQEADHQIQRYAGLCRERDRFPGIGALSHRFPENDPAEGLLRHHERGGRLGLFGERAGDEGVPGIRRGAAVRRLHHTAIDNPVHDTGVNLVMDLGHR